MLFSIRVSPSRNLKPCFSGLRVPTLGRSFTSFHVIPVAASRVETTVSRVTTTGEVTARASSYSHRERSSRRAELKQQESSRRAELQQQGNSSKEVEFQQQGE